MAENLPTRTRRGQQRTPPPPVRSVELPDPPPHLTPEAQAMWTGIVEEWVLDAAALPLLQGALEAWDQCQRCRAIVAEEGETVTSPSGLPRSHPALKAGLDSFAAFRQAMRQLGLAPEV